MRGPDYHRWALRQSKATADLDEDDNHDLDKQDEGTSDQLVHDNIPNQAVVGPVRIRRMAKGSMEDSGLSRRDHKGSLHGDTKDRGKDF